MTDMRKIGLYFGSFNPVHIGHLIIAESILGITDLEEIWMVVSPQNPFKAKKGLLDHHARLELIEMATKGNKAVKGSSVEFDLPIPSYTIDTLRHLSKVHPDYQFSILMGEDNLEHLDKWKESDELIYNYPIYVYPRLNYFSNKFDHITGVQKVKAPIIELSSTSIREKIQKGESIRYVVKDEVRQLIEERNYYKSNEDEEE